MRNEMWLLSGSVLWLTLVHCNGDTNQSSKSFYTAVNEQLEKSAVNCSRFIPDGMQELMSEYEPPDDSTGGQMLVEYLLLCLHRRLVRMNEASPFALTASPQILYDLVLNQVVSLGFDGKLVTKVMVIFEWNDTRLQWRTYTGIGNWTFPELVYYPISDVWVPSFRLANCQSEGCVVKPQESKTLELYNGGRIVYESEMVLRSTCDLDLTWFPLDEQNCKLEFIETDLQNSERVQLLQCPQVYTYYMAESAEWIVRALTHHPHPYSILYLNYSTNGKWNRSKEFFSNLSFTVKITLKRHPHYYIYNLIVPVLLVAFTGIASVFIPTQTDSKLNVPITVVLTFIFLQALVASMSPKTPISPIVANYILWSLLLAAFQVCACAIIWKTSTLPHTSKPWQVLVLLFVFCMSSAFWLHLLHKCCRCRKSHVCVSEDSPGPENIQLQASNGCEMIQTAQDMNGVSKEHEVTRNVENMNSWEAVAHGLNHITTILYLLGNAIVFTLYLYPLLYRIIVHSAVNGYVADIE